MPPRGSLLALLLGGAVLWASEQNVTVSPPQPHRGEPVRITYTLLLDKGEAGMDLRFTPPPLEHMQVRERRAGMQIRQGMQVWSEHIVAVPLRPGVLTTGDAAMHVARRENRRDAWGQWMPAVVWKNYPFAARMLTVLPVPPGIDAVGRFRMEAGVRSDKVRSGAPLQLTLSLSGCGDLDLVPAPELTIPGVNVFEEAVSQEAQWREGCLYSESNRSYTLVASEDFTIPSVTLQTFDPVLGTIVPLRSAPISIRVEGTATAETAHIYKEEDMGIWMVMAAMVLGFLLGIGATLIYRRRGRSVRHKGHDSHRDALVALFRHLDDPEAQKSVEKMEKYLYEEGPAPDDAELTALFSRLKRLRESS